MSRDTVRKAFAGGLAFFVVALLAPQAAAQERRTEISAGWSYAHGSAVSFPAGWYASVGQYVNDWFGIVGEVNGHYKTVSDAGTDVNRNFHMFGAGPRFAYRKYPRLTPFVDLLAGGRRADGAGNGFGANADQSTTHFAYQSNFGLAINNDRGSLGLRLSVGDYGIRSNGKWTNDSLFEIGVVLRP